MQKTRFITLPIPFGWLLKLYIRKATESIDSMAYEMIFISIFYINIHTINLNKFNCI